MKNRIVALAFVTILMLCVIAAFILLYPSINIKNLENKYEKCIIGHDLAGAIINLRKLVAADSENSEYRILLADAYYQNDNIDMAESAYIRLLEEFPDDLVLMGKYAALCEKNGNSNELIRIICLIQEKNPDIGNLYRLADIYGNTGEYDKAAAALEDIIQIEPEDIDSLEQLADLYEETGNLSGAVRTLEKLLLISSDISINQRLADLYNKQNDVKNEILHIKALLKMNPKDSLLYSRAGLLSMLLFDHEAAADYFEEACRYEPGNLSYAVDYGELLIYMGNYSQALDFIKHSEARKRGNELDDLYKMLTEKPAAPEFSVKEGAYEKGSDLFVSIEHPEMDVDIFYTVDGTWPDENSLIYEGPVQVLGDGTDRTRLAAAVRNELGIWSAMSVSHYSYPVEFIDKGLEKIIADHFGVEPGKITMDMLDKVNRIEVWGDKSKINADHWSVINGYSHSGYAYDNMDNKITGTGEIKSLKDIKYFKNIEVISVNMCDIAGLPDFSSLNKLSIVRLIGNGITDISMCTTLSSVDELYLGGNEISNMNALKNLYSLRVLNLSYNNIRELCDLRGMESVIEISLSHNDLMSIKGIEALEKLKTLNVSMNNIDSLEPLAGMTQLDELYISYIGLSDISPIRNLTKLSELNISHNNITDITALSEMKSLKMLNMSDNNVSDLSPLMNLRSLHALYLMNNAAGFDMDVIDQLTWIGKIKLES